ncbi:unnamed protein product, partial [Schistosoma margrebowiei]
GIENIKKEQSSWEKQSTRKNFIKAFGAPFSWRWFSPFSSPSFVPTILPGLPDDVNLTNMLYLAEQNATRQNTICQSNQSVNILGNFSSLACSAFALGLICESLMFGIFTLVMCISQLCAISNDETINNVSSTAKLSDSENANLP